MRNIVIGAVVGGIIGAAVASLIVGNGAPKSAVAAATPAATASKKDEIHRLVLHVDDNDPARMNLALNNASNVLDHYREKGQLAEVEIVAYGPGLHMLRSDTSPVKDRIAKMKKAMDGLEFVACGNTMTNMGKAESKEIAVLPEAKIVKTGVVHLMERQKEGWNYVRP